MSIKLTLQKILKGSLHTEEQDKCNHENMRKNKPYQTDIDTSEE
jgi:hypothetical protein